MTIPVLIKSILFRLKKYKIRMRIGNFMIRIPMGHALPYYFTRYKLYDKFLPILAQFIPENKIIVDVGANIGDSTIAMVQQNGNKIVSIEPSEYFYNFLIKNINNLPINLKTRIRVEKGLVGTGIIKGQLSRGQSSAYLKKDSANIVNPVSLDFLMDKEVDEIGLIKVDTDGYDFDVLNSANSSIQKFKPVLFWENEILDFSNLKNFFELYKNLFASGYKHFYVFDNFGNLLIEDCSDTNVLNQINAYIFNQKNTHKSIFYTDILACTDDKLPSVKSAIAKFKTFYRLD